MICVAILDDNVEFAQSLADAVLHYPQSDQLDVVIAHDYRELETELRAGRIDVLFIDIELSPDGPDGIQVVYDLIPVGASTQVVYVTGYASYHTKVYQTRHAYFLMKPIDQIDLDAALGKALRAVDARKSTPLRIHTREGEKVVHPDSIVFIESDRRILRFHTVDGTFQAYAKIVDVLSKLPPRFVQCHKSFVINMDYITDFTSGSVRMQSGETIPISKSRHKDVRNAFFSYVRSIG